MHEGAGRVVGDGVCHLIRRQHGRECHISAGQRLAYAHDVRFHTGMFPGEQFAGPSESRRNLVEYQQQIVFLAETCCFTQILRVIEPHAACTLYDGFEDKCGQFVVVPFYCFFQREEVFRIPFAVEPRGGLRNKVAYRQ